MLTERDGWVRLIALKRNVMAAGWWTAGIQKAT